MGVTRDADRKVYDIPLILASIAKLHDTEAVGDHISEHGCSIKIFDKIDSNRCIGPTFDPP